MVATARAAKIPTEIRASQPENQKLITTCQAQGHLDVEIIKQSLLR